MACGDKFLVAGRGTRYQRPKTGRAANVLIYDNAASGLPAALEKVPVDTLLKREGHSATRVETLDQLAAMVAFCIKPAADAPKSDAQAPCTVKAPPKERSFLEAIDKAVLTHDRNARKALART